MIRCPFNNFSKCDGSCPFSMPDFTGCRLATALVAIEGASKGMHAQVVTTNAHLTDVRDKLDGIASATELVDDGIEGKAPRIRGHKVKHPECSYLTFSLRSAKVGQPKAVIALNEEHAALAIGTLGETCAYVINDADKSIVLMRGETNKIYRNGTHFAISAQSDGSRLVGLFPDCRHVYLDAEAFAGMLVLRPTGEVD